ncbi:MAG TPA: DUF427 domain-containing protein [Burkholderiales bacterium]|nr:DUF427 domain-containing protein [Burkholderiales bacterium]
MSTNSGPGYKKYPDHRITTKPAGVRVQVKLDGEVIADTRDAIRLEEGDYPAVYYFPRKDVKMERLVRSKHQSVCPFKGTASYYSLANGAENAVWTYETPYDEVSVIKERLAFYPDKVDSIAADAE